MLAETCRLLEEKGVAVRSEGALWVFFDDVKVPKENLVGEINKGWTCAKYLLEFERGNAYSGGLKRWLQQVRKMAQNERSSEGMALIARTSAYRSALRVLRACGYLAVAAGDGMVRLGPVVAAWSERDVDELRRGYDLLPCRVEEG